MSEAVRRPIPVTTVALLFLAVGTLGSILHGIEIQKNHSWLHDGIAIELTELAALVTGIFLLRRNNWARWLAVIWMLFHVVLSMFNNVREVIVHAVLLILVAWCLFRPSAWWQRDR